MPWRCIQFLRFSLFSLLLIITAGSAFSADAPLKLKVAVLKNFPPQYSTSPSGEPQGFAIDVINEVARLANFEVQYVVKDSWKELFQALRAGEADLTPNQGVTQRRKKWFAYTSPVETFPVRIFVRAAAKKVQSLKDLSGHKVGVVRLNVGEVLVARNPKIEAQVFEHLQDALFELLAGNVDAIIYPEPVLRLLARQVKLEKRIAAAGPPLIEIKRAISVRKDNRVLLARLDKAVRNLVESKAYQTIYARWYGEPPPLITTLQLGLIMGAAIVLAVIGMAIWRYRSLAQINVNLVRNIDQREQAEKALQEAHDRLEDRVHDRTRALSDANTELQIEVERRLGAERDLREKERFLALIFDSIQDGISVLTPDLIIQHTNKAMQTLYAEHRPLEGNYCYETYRGLEQPCEDCPTLRCLKSHRLEMEEVPLVQKGVPTGVLEVYAYPMLDDNGDVTGVVEYLRDTTERKQAERALADSQRRLADIIEFLPDPTLVIDKDGRVIAWNLAIERTTGVKKEEMLGQGDYAYAVPFYGERRPLLIDLALRPDARWEKTYLTLKKDEGVIKESESFHPRMGPEGRYFAGKASRLYDAQGNVAGAIEIIRDITASKRTEQERERLIAELREALEMVDTLSGFLPICANCKKIRDDQGYWNQLEAYISRHSQAQFSHGICPDCAQELYGDDNPYNEDP